MTTEHTVTESVPRDTASLVSRTWLPWAVGISSGVAAWLIEAALHHFVFEDRTYVAALFQPAPHEFWMRLLVAMLLGMLTFGWAAAIQRHRRQGERLLAYQAELRRIATRLAHGQNEAYGAIADRLHEDVAQSLAAARLFLSAAEDEGTPADPKVIHEVSRILDRAIVECRQIAKELSPPALETYGLSAALESMATQVMLRSGVSVEVSGGELPELPREMRLAAYQALAEIVAVAASDPTTQTIRIHTDGSTGTANVSVSWDAENPSDILSTESAFTVLGGTVTRAAVDGGTAVTLRTPDEHAA